MRQLSNIIQSVNISCFRNLTQLDLPCCSQVNVFYGKNGSGKTSILEAIHYLSLFKSFRTTSYLRLLQNQKKSFYISINLKSSDGIVRVGVERHASGAKKIRFDGEDVNSAAVLAKQLPVIMIDPHSYRFFHDGPKVRRSFVDFGLFHVEHNFYEVWKQFHYVLKQRNACLKQRRSREEVDAWSGEFCRLAELLDLSRKSYLKAFRIKYMAFLSTLLPNYSGVQLRYHSGWDSESSLEFLMEKSYYSDAKVGFTQLGPHRSDIQLYCESMVPAQDFFSQGQQKLASYALYLAQGAMLQEMREISPVYLIDDLPSELDADKNQQLVALLQRINAQIFVTGVQKEDLMCWKAGDDVNMFHVKQGEAVISQ